MRLFTSLTHFLQRAGLARPTFLAVFIAVAGIYAFTAPVEYLTTDGAVREMVAQNLYTHGDLALRQVEAGQTLNDLWTTGHDGRPYAYFGIGQSLLQLPFIALLDGTERLGLRHHLMPTQGLPVTATLLLSGGLLIAFLFGIVLRLGYTRRTALKVAALAGFASIAWGLSRQSYDMLQAAAGVIGAIYFVLTARAAPERRVLHCLLAGISLGLAAITRVSVLISGPALAILVLGSPQWGSWRERWRAAAWCIAGGLAVVWWIPAYNLIRFGSVLNFGYGGHPPYAGAPLLRGLTQWLISPWRGALIYMPLLLALPIVWPGFMRRERTLGWALIVLAASDLLFHAQYTKLGLYGWGPYYAVGGLLGLTIPFAELFEAPRRFPTWQRVLAGGLIALSVVVQLPSLVVPSERYQTLLVVEEADTPGEARIWSPRWSPLRMQAEGSLNALRNLSDWPRYMESPSDLSAETRLAELYSFNLPDWWWLYRLLSGGQTGLIVPVVSLLCAAWLIWQITLREPLPRDAEGSAS
jgi:hypothetical protein